MASYHDEFAQTIARAHHINEECLKISTELSQLTTMISENECEFSCLRAITFRPVSHHSESLYVLRFHGDTRRHKLNSLKSCFQPPIASNWQNLFRTPIPDFNYKNLESEIKIYEILDPVKGLEETKGFVDSLMRAEEELRERLNQVKTTIGLGSTVIQNFSSYFEKRETPKEERGPQSKSEIFFQKRIGEPYVKRLRLEFELEFSHERALNDLDHFERMLAQYFEVVEDQGKAKTKSTQENQEKERQEKEKQELNRKILTDSLIAQGFQLKEQVVEWLAETRVQNPKEIKTSLLFRGSRDGFKTENFHTKCDEKGSTLVVVRSSNGRIFGGYSHLPWHSKGEWSVDTERKSFLFSLDSNTKYHINETDFTIYGRSDYGPVFGRGHGLSLAANCHQNTLSQSAHGSYPIPSDLTLAGSENFQVSDYEVWKIE